MPFGLTPLKNIRQINSLLFRFFKILLLVLVVMSFTFSARADVVKPALIEINVFADGDVKIEIRTSLEALLSGINGRYKNTQDSPNADRYDEFRRQSATELAISFKSFNEQLLKGIELTVDRDVIELSLISIDIPEPGYTKVPRTSIIMLEGKIPDGAEILYWYYPAAFGDHAVRVKLNDVAREYWHWSDYQWIRDDKVSEPFEINGLIKQSSALRVLKTYTEAGFLHILPRGLDHILFIFGLFLMSRRFRPLFWQATLFTLAHSITLSLSTFGIFDLPPMIVEPLIALSITYIAVENLWSKSVSNARLWLVFAFGLLHGMGFATMLLEFGLPEDRFVLALLGFNLGVEGGQISILLLAWFGFGLWLRNWPGYRRWIVTPLSIAIGLTGVLWFWQRLPVV